MKLFWPFAGLGKPAQELTPGREKLALTKHDRFNSSFDADLNAPADGVPAHPPVITRVQVLPFGELTWENFERLCYRFAGRTERVEYVARYGRSGQAQQGIDLFARLANGKYEVWQAKRYEAITARQVKAIVDAFRAGTWKDKSEQLILAVQASLADTKVQDEIEAQATALKAEGITFVPRGGEELSELLRAIRRSSTTSLAGSGSKPFLARRPQRRWVHAWTVRNLRACERSCADFMTLTFTCWTSGLRCRSARLMRRRARRRRCSAASPFPTLWFATPRPMCSAGRGRASLRTRPMRLPGLRSQVARHRSRRRGGAIMCGACRSQIGSQTA
jgi:hypothetical protein